MILATKYVGKTIKFISGNFEGLKAVVEKLSYDNKYIYGVALLAKLEDNRIVIIEKSEHFEVLD